MKTNKARIQHDLEVLATYTSTPGHGVTRSSYSKEDKMAKEYLKEEMKKLGLQIYNAVRKKRGKAKRRAGCHVWIPL